MIQIAYVVWSTVAKIIYFMNLKSSDRFTKICVLSEIWYPICEKFVVQDKSHFICTSEASCKMNVVMTVSKDSDY